MSLAMWQFFPLNHCYCAWITRLPVWS